MDLKQKLLDAVERSGAHADPAVLAHAFDVAFRAHDGQTRKSGEPYITHPVEVAMFLADLRLDTASLATAILHDTVEDTELTSNDLVLEFGEEISDLVNGVTKLTQLELSSEDTKQAENFRKLLLAISKDVRVLLVKLADRLHNMRTLGSLRDEKKRRIALETMEIYAPLAALSACSTFVTNWKIAHLKS